MSSKSVTKGNSVRRNRDYSEKFTWTEDLNKDLYQLYVIAKQEGPGFMKRLKLAWDAKHPQLNYFNEKQLRQQAWQYGKKREARSDRNDYTTANALSRPIVEYETVPNNILDTELGEKFLQNFARFADLALDERPCDTRSNVRIPDSTIDAVNQIIEAHLQNMQQVSLWSINVITYAAAITAIESHGRLKYRTARPERNKKPAWIHLHEEQTNALRRKISRTTCVLKCQQESHFTKKQAQIATKVKRECKTLNHKTLQSKVSLLKHDLKP